MSVLLIADINGNDSSVDQTSKALSAAKELGSVTILSFGSGIEELNNNLKKLEPIDRVLTVEKDSFSNGSKRIRKRNNTFFWFRYRRIK